MCHIDKYPLTSGAVRCHIAAIIDKIEQTLELCLVIETVYLVSWLFVNDHCGDLALNIVPSQNFNLRLSSSHRLIWSITVSGIGWLWMFRVNLRSDQNFVFLTDAWRMTSCARPLRYPTIWSAVIPQENAFFTLSRLMMPAIMFSNCVVILVNNRSMEIWSGEEV